MCIGGENDEKHNHLAENLRLHQHLRGASLAEFSEELGIARSTVQSILSDGNTTVDTLVRMANAIDVSLDELVFGAPAAAQPDCRLLTAPYWFAALPPEKQADFWGYAGRLRDLLRAGNEPE